MVQYYSRDEDFARRSSSGRSLSVKRRNSVEPLETAQCKSSIEEKNWVRLREVIVRLRSKGRGSKVTEERKIKPTGPYFIFTSVRWSNKSIITKLSLWYHVWDNSKIHSNRNIFTIFLARKGKWPVQKCGSSNMDGESRKLWISYMMLFL